MASALDQLRQRLDSQQIEPETQETPALDRLRQRMAPQTTALARLRKQMAPQESGNAPILSEPEPPGFGSEVLNRAGEMVTGAFDVVTGGLRNVAVKGQERGLAAHPGMLGPEHENAFDRIAQSIGGVLSHPKQAAKDFLSAEGTAIKKLAVGLDDGEEEKIPSGRKVAERFAPGYAKDYEGSSPKAAFASTFGKELALTLVSWETELPGSVTGILSLIGSGPKAVAAIKANPEFFLTKGRQAAALKARGDAQALKEAAALEAEIKAAATERMDRAAEEYAGKVNRGPVEGFGAPEIQSAKEKATGFRSQLEQHVEDYAEAAKNADHAVASEARQAAHLKLDEELMQASQRRASIPEGPSERVKPFLGKAWDVIKNTGAAVGFKPNLTTEGKELLTSAATRANMITAQIKKPLSDAAQALSRDEKKWLSGNFRDVYQAGGSAPADMPGAQRFMDEWRKVSEPIPRRFQAAGKDVGKLKNYVPQVWTDEFETQVAKGEGKLFQAWREEVKRLNPGITDEQIANISDTIAGEIKHGAIPGAPTADVTKSRFFKNMPSSVTVGGKTVKILETDPYMLSSKYAKRVGNSLSQAELAKEAGTESFGSMASEVRRGIVRGGGNADAFDRQMKMLGGARHLDPVANVLGSKYISPVRNIANGIAMTMSGLTQAALGHFPAMATTGARNYVKATWKYMTGRATQDVEFAKRLGAWSDHSLANMAGVEDVGGWSQRVGKGIPELSQTERLNNQIHKITAVATKYGLDDLVAKAKSGDAKAVSALRKSFYFSNKRVSDMIASGIKDADYSQAMQVATSKANLAYRLPTEVTFGSTHQLVNDMFAFTGMTRALGNLTVETVGKAAKGDVMPLIYLVGGTYAGNETKKAIMSWLRNKENKASAEQTVFDMGLIGMPGQVGSDMTYAAEQRNRKDLLQAVWERRAPMWMRFLDASQQWVRGNAKPIRRMSSAIDAAAVQGGGAEPLGKKEATTYRRRTRR